MPSFFSSPFLNQEKHFLYFHPDLPRKKGKNTKATKGVREHPWRLHIGTFWDPFPIDNSRRVEGYVVKLVRARSRSTYKLLV
jgi:hypothetical protein